MAKTDSPPDSPVKDIVKDSDIQVTTETVYGDESDSMDPVYEHKARILNNAIQEIGMGRYQVSFVLIEPTSVGAD